MLEDNQMDIEESFDDASAKRKHDELTGLNEQDYVISKNPPVSAGTAFHYDVSEASSLRTVSKVPLSRIKRILKEDNEFQGATTDAYTVISKATELFIKMFATDSYNVAARDSRVSVQYKDCATLVSNVDKYEFLTDVVPTPLSLRKALEITENSAPKK
ncbi:hypothetical protein DSO57_1030844 [Entomophthora muscae]|uniref:Uncharacterized protein n=1 Tax=Entomophthora muscae TaxID=34485 RepID=A0ACC2S386_9FUNG|nr:hypothetical protein DSO57_1030844 [Entomophthora muscae]